LIQNFPKVYPKTKT